MEVAIATGNIIKIHAAERAFTEAFEGKFIRVHRVTLDLDLPEQPMGEAIAEGAMVRAIAAQRRIQADYGLGIEAGLMQLPGSARWLSVQICAVIDPTGRTSIGMGPGYELPEPILNAVLGGEPLRDAFERLLVKDDPERLGAIYYLSHGLIDRTELTIQGIRMALLPWRPL